MGPGRQNKERNGTKISLFGEEKQSPCLFSRKRLLGVTVVIIHYLCHPDHSLFCFHSTTTEFPPEIYLHSLSRALCRCPSPGKPANLLSTVQDSAFPTTSKGRYTVCIHPAANQQGQIPSAYPSSRTPGGVDTVCVSILGYTQCVSVRQSTRRIYTVCIRPSGEMGARGWGTLVWWMCIVCVGSGFNITTYLWKHPDLSTFNNLLTATNVAGEINNRSSLTILALSNAQLEPFISSFGGNLPTQEVSDVLRYHVLLEYLDWDRLQQMTIAGTLVTTLYQTTGRAPGNTGAVNITTVGGQVRIGMPVENAGFNSTIVGLVDKFPYVVSIARISTMILPYGFDLSGSPAPSSLGFNVTDALVKANNFNFFVSLMEASGVVSEFQSEESGAGITIFAPTDDAFTALHPETLQGLTADKKALILKYHVLLSYYPLGSLQTIVNPVQPTLATQAMGASSYTLNITQIQGDVAVNTGIVQAPVTETVFDQKPLAIFAIPKVLLPREIFGQKSAPTPSPAPAPAPANFPFQSPGPSPFSGISQPPISVPAFSQSPISVPAFSKPPISVPAFSRPPISVPAYARPPISVPVYARPPISVPAFSRPPISVPAYARPPISVPAFVRPPTSVPVISPSVDPYPPLLAPSFSPNQGISAPSPLISAIPPSTVTPTPMASISAPPFPSMSTGTAITAPSPSPFLAVVGKISSTAPANCIVGTAVLVFTAFFTVNLLLETV